MKKNYKLFFIIATILLVIMVFVSIGLGRYSMNPTAFLNGLFHPTKSSTSMLVLWKVRIPRIVMAILIGSGLAVSGATLQAIFGNPLVSEHILGVSSGAGFGAAFGILFIGSTLGIQISSIIFGLLSMAIACMIAKKNGSISVLMLVLSGIIVSSVFSSGISLLQYFADPDNQLPTIVFWLMGGLSKVTVSTVIRTAPIILTSIFILYKIRWQLNIASLNEEEAISLGVNIKRIRLLSIVLATTITATSVAACGMITFVGLVIPHFTRMLIGNNNKILLPGAMLLGAIFLLVVDNFARTITSAEIPLSILTSIVGAPFFAYLLHKTGGVWND
ncbi:iron ABC transporter permease [Clostridium oceanicum]|uniref:Iron ABC transporter permease n=1 Tax=Clostridium oceanicum TaxID=1543 RepID=A0ABP3UH04_9CLOT